VLRITCVVLLNGNSAGRQAVPLRSARWVVWVIETRLDTHSASVEGRPVGGQVQAVSLVPKLVPGLGMVSAGFPPPSDLRRHCIVAELYDRFGLELTTAMSKRSPWMERMYCTSPSDPTLRSGSVKPITSSNLSLEILPPVSRRSSSHLLHSSAALVGGDRNEWPTCGGSACC
jgi:hypothetical protein